MIKHKMTINEGDVPGDCFRTVIACLLDKEPRDVPHFFSDEPESELGWQRVNDYLATQGLALWMMAFPGTAPLSDVLQSIAVTNPEMYYIVVGKGGYDEDHAVIAINDTITHDPASMSPGLTGPAKHGYWMVMTLIHGGLVRQP